MDEVASPEVEAAVRGTGLVGCEEDEVAGYELAGTRGAQTEFVLFVGRARDDDAVLAEDVLQVAGAIKGFGRAAAEEVRRAHVFLGREDEVVYLAARQDGRAVRCEFTAALRPARARRRLCRGMPDGRLYLAAPGAFLRLQQRAPGGTVHDARDANLVVALELGHGLLRALAVDAVRRAYVVANLVQLLLQYEHIVAVRALLQGRGGQCRAGKQQSGQPGTQYNAFTMKMFQAEGLLIIVIVVGGDTALSVALFALSRAGRARGPGS